MTQFYKTKKIVVGLTALFFAMTFTAKAQYTLTDDDVVMENGYIRSLTEQGKINVKSESIIIPQTLLSQTVKGIMDKYWTPELGVLTEGIFGDYGITNVTFPSTFEHVGADAFFSNQITNLDFSTYPSLISIGAWSFTNDEEGNITHLNLKNLVNLTTIKERAFNEQPIEELDISGCVRLTKIDKGAFYYNKLTKIDFSGLSSLTTIGERAFQCNGGKTSRSLIFSGCTALSSIEDYAFLSWNLSTLNLSSCRSLIYIGKAAFDSRHTDLTGFVLPTPQIDGLTFNTWQNDKGNNMTEANSLENSYTALFDEKVISLSGQLVSNRGTESESSSAAVLKSATEAVHQVKFTIRNHSKNPVDIAGISTSNSGTLSWSNGTIASGKEQEVTITYPDSNYENTIIVKGDNLKGNTTLNITERGDVSSDGNLVPTSTSKPTMEQSNISIYPNPVKNTVTIAVSGNSMQGETVSIINLAGNTVYQTSNFINQQTIDISNLPDGIYFVKVGTVIRKMIKE